MALTSDIPANTINFNRALSSGEVKGVRTEKERRPSIVLTQADSFKNPAKLTEQYVVTSQCENSTSRLAFEVGDETPREVILEMIAVLARWTSTHV